MEVEAIDRTDCRSRFGRGYRPVIRQTIQSTLGPRLKKSIRSRGLDVTEVGRKSRL
jgi:hypothetical protein